MDEQGELKIGNPAARGAARWATLREVIDAALGEGWTRAEKSGWPHYAAARCYEGWRHDVSGRILVLKLQLGEHPELMACWPDHHMEKAARLAWCRELADRWAALYIAARTVVACAPDVTPMMAERGREARRRFVELVEAGGFEG
jgi:hypothetical protein